MKQWVLAGLLATGLTLSGPAQAVQDEAEAEDAESDGHGISITLSNSDADSRLADQVVEDIQSEVNRVIDRLPNNLEDSMSEDEWRQLQSDMDRLKNLGSMTDAPARHHGFGPTWSGDGGASEYAVDIVAVLMVFGMPIMIVAIVSYNARRKREMVHQTIERIVENGREVPGELLDALDKGKDGQSSSLRRAAFNIAVGAGIGIFLWNVADQEVATLGLIPLFIDISYLVIWWLERDKVGSETA